MTGLDELIRLTCGPGGVMGSSKAIENVKVDEATSFAAPISKESNSTSLYCLGQGGGKGLCKE